MLRKICLFGLLLSAVSGATTVSQALLRADGQPFTGSFRISWPTYTNCSGVIRPAGYTNISLNPSTGVFTVALEHRNPATPCGPLYTVEYDRLRQGTRRTEIWDVPSSGSTLAIDDVITEDPATAPSVVSSLPYLTVVGTITTGVWNGTAVTAQYGGTGDNTSSTTGVPKITSGNWTYDAAASDLASWPAGVDMTEVGYLNGVTSAIQTQLDAKPAYAATTQTWGAGSTLAWTFSVTGTDPVLTPSDGAISLAGNFSAERYIIARSTGSTPGYFWYDGDEGSETFGQFAAADGSTLTLGTYSGGGYVGPVFTAIRSSRNFLVGGATDGNYKLDIQTSGSSGTARFYDSGGADASVELWLGSTQIGSGDAPFRIMRTGGTTELAGIDNAGAFFSSNGTTRVTLMGVTGFTQAANFGLAWSNTNNDVDQTRDTGLSRIAPGVLAVGTGTAGSSAGRIALDSTTPSASSDACTAKSIWADANFIYYCVSSGTIKRSTLSAF